METDRSNYAGLAAASVFLVGLLIVGNAAVRIAVLGVIAFGIALAVSRTQSRRLLVWSIAIALCSTMVAYKAVSFQIRGEATYFNGKGRWYLGTELVSRNGSPAKFRQAIQETWGVSMFLALVTGICFTFHRKLRAVEYEPDL